MRVTTKGQVTIPKDIRDRLGIKPGSEVEFVPRADGRVELLRTGGVEDRKRLEALHDWFDRLEGAGDSGFSAEDVMAMTRDRDDGNAH
ncbi:MAG: AbrB/MazE/SpoVT family DNA-binding domain-containing protein [Rhizobiaceae bacterium]|nr:AbrB/MazE/SpoVT family DNA-binding domain-containing protein [Rhizobiaceae bacterium]